MERKRQRKEKAKKTEHEVRRHLGEERTENREEIGATGGTELPVTPTLDSPDILIDSAINLEGTGEPSE